MLIGGLHRKGRVAGQVYIMADFEEKQLREEEVLKKSQAIPESDYVYFCAIVHQTVIFSANVLPP
jgi:hypothetical protein